MNDLNGITLAYLGDAIYELKVRDYLVNRLNLRHVGRLHKLSVQLTNAKSQSKVIDYLLENDLLSEDELIYFKRGRNSSASQSSKTCSTGEYKKATGFESLVAHLKDDQKRLDEIIQIAFDLILEGENL